jgi:transaldolase
VTATARLVAQVAVATQIGPCDLLEAPPSVFSAILEVLREQSEEQDKQARETRLKDKLRKQMGR